VLCLRGRGMGWSVSSCAGWRSQRTLAPVATLVMGVTRGSQPCSSGRPGRSWLFCPWQLARRSCAIGCMTWSASSAAPYPGAPVQRGGDTPPEPRPGRCRPHPATTTRPAAGHLGPSHPEGRFAEPGRGTDQDSSGPILSARRASSRGRGTNPHTTRHGRQRRRRGPGRLAPWPQREIRQRAALSGACPLVYQGADASAASANIRR
jgi:hypothetical protein